VCAVWVVHDLGCEEWEANFFVDVVVTVWLSGTPADNTTAPEK